MGVDFCNILSRSFPPTNKTIMPRHLRKTEQGLSCSINFNQETQSGNDSGIIQGCYVNNATLSIQCFAEGNWQFSFLPWLIINREGSLIVRSPACLSFEHLITSKSERTCEIRWQHLWNLRSIYSCRMNKLTD